MFTMKKIIPVLLILAYVLSACAPAAFTETKAGGEMTPVETEASPEVQNEPTTAGTAPPVPASIADRPRGIFVLTDLSVGKDSAQKTSKQLDQVIQLDYVTGVTLRVLWGKTETSRGQYDFSAVDDALSGLQTTDKKLNFDGSPYAGFQQPWSTHVGILSGNIERLGSADGQFGQVSVCRERPHVHFVQALTAWSRPFTGADKVSSGKAAAGIQFAYETYDATYVEIYLADALDPSQVDDLRKWNTVLTGLTPP